MELLALVGTSPVLAHGSDPIAIIGFFGPALVLVAIVVAAAVYDRKRHARGQETQRAEHRRGISPPGAG